MAGSLEESLHAFANSPFGSHGFQSVEKERRRPPFRCFSEALLAIDLALPWYVADRIEFDRKHEMN